MAENELEIKHFIEERLRRVIDDKDIYYHADKILLKLKARGYVKWDREKVAKRLAYIGNSTTTKTLGEDSLWDWFSVGDCDYWKGKADQLKEILTGGE